jgi:D-beta-D-heptose 7-phosphate kinase / D-beta-D-heptose 1-phosphate adenosyltransferase
MNDQQALSNVVQKAFVTLKGENPRVLVVGDVMLDRYLWGDVERISPEAPVPVVRLIRQSEQFGGSANVAANLSGLGVTTFLSGYVGDDAEGETIIALMKSAGIYPNCLVRLSDRPTITKTRVMCGHQQMLRLDQEYVGKYSEEQRQQLLNGILDFLALQPIDAIVFSDYAKGVLDAELCQAIIHTARHKGIFVLVDPKGRDYSKYKGANALTPNLREAAEACAVTIHDIDAVLEGAVKLRQQLELDFIAVTRSEDGISVIDSDSISHLPTVAKDVFDVSGAGDTVIATLTAGLVAGLTSISACELANRAAAIVVAKVGTVPVRREELLDAIQLTVSLTQADKICDLETLIQRSKGWQKNGGKIVFTNGCFDLLHAGHVTYLESAKRLGQRLIVGLNTDRSISALKGPTRPVIQQQDRARVIAALESVDAVVLFDDDTPLALINLIKPDVLAKGNDYKESEVVGASEVKSWGGRVSLIPVLADRSTSKIITKLSA